MPRQAFIRVMIVKRFMLQHVDRNFAAYFAPKREVTVAASLMQG
jgi:hypothetical protein